MDTALYMKTQLYDICYPLDISTCFTHQPRFYSILFITMLVKPHGIPQFASISYVIDLTELLINGWPEDGFSEAETCSHPNSVFNIILELCLTDSSVDVPLLEQHNGMDHIKKLNIQSFRTLKCTTPFANQFSTG
jgi:hypothetical protein